MHWLAALMILAQLMIAVAPQPAPSSGARVPASKAAPTLTDGLFSYTFGQEIHFQAVLKPETGAAIPNVRQMLLWITPEGQQANHQIMVVGEPEALLEARTTPEPDTNTGGGVAGSETPADAVLASANVDVRQIVLYPFSQVSYYYEATLEDGTTVKSDTFHFNYDDNRFTWQSAENSAFHAYWNGSDSSLGQAILNIAEDGLRQARDVLAADPPGPIRIYAYSSSRDLQSALQLTNQPYIAGHATPELGMIMISVPSGPERKLELERQIPHEIMHILQYQVMGKTFTRQPIWLIEGMASLAELTQNPEYRIALDTTVKQGKLLPLSSLCLAFPRDASDAFLAYAQSDSFVRFLYQKYGASGLRKLVDAYQNGLGCEEGLSSALGVSLHQIEYRWQQEELGMNAGALAFSNLSPYLLVGLVLLLIPAVTFLLPYRSRKPISQGSSHD